MTNLIRPNKALWNGKHAYDREDLVGAVVLAGGWNIKHLI